MTRDISMPRLLKPDKDFPASASLVGDSDPSRIGVVDVPFPNEDTNRILDALKKSATFAMSLGAKELFHTNFLAFILESEAKELETAQEQLKALFFGPNKVGPVTTWREKNNLDLVLVAMPQTEKLQDFQAGFDPKVCSIVVIEAKLKSVPTPEQLETYDAKLGRGVVLDLEDPLQLEENSESKDQFPLLAIEVVLSSADDCIFDVSLHPEKPDGPQSVRNKEEKKKKKQNVARGRLRKVLLTPNGNGVGKWEGMSWRKVADQISLGTAGNKLIGELVMDYKESLGNIDTLLQRVSAHVGDPPNSSVKFASYYGSITDRVFRNCRLHDLVGKYASYLISESYFAFLTKQWAKQSEPNETRVTFMLGTGVSFDLNRYVHFSNQQPSFGIEWVAKNKIPKEHRERRICCGIQVQGTKYRHYVSVSGPSGVERDPRISALAALASVVSGQSVLNATQQPSGWFTGVGTGFPTLTGKIRGGAFRVFSDSAFWYSEVDIGSKSLADLSQLIKTSLENARGMIALASTKHADDLKVFLSLTPKKSEEKTLEGSSRG